MNISVILGHPNPDSFCHAIARVVTDTLHADQHVVRMHDLHAEGFDPLMSAREARTRVSDNALVEQHCAELAAAEGLVVVHPSWWGMPPAILKGWIDRVIRPGVAYELQPDASGARTVHVPKLRVKTALVLNTSDLPPESNAPGSVTRLVSFGRRTSRDSVEWARCAVTRLQSWGRARRQCGRNGWSRRARWCETHLLGVPSQVEADARAHRHHISTAREHRPGLTRRDCGSSQVSPCARSFERCFRAAQFHRYFE